MKSSIPQNPCRYAVSSSSLCDAHCCLYTIYTSLGIIKTRNKVYLNELSNLFVKNIFNVYRLYYMSSLLCLHKGKE